MNKKRKKSGKAYELFEHTADVGLRVSGRDLRALFANAAFGLFDVITDVEAVKSGLKNNPAGFKKFSFQLSSAGLEDLFLEWLRELLFSFAARRVIWLDFDFLEITKTKLKVDARGVVFDPGRHEQRHEVKAVTYHGFKLEKQRSGWIAEVILDI